jgi:amino acid transporter
VILVCVFANIRGARLVGGSSLLMLFALLGPFVILIMVAFGSRPVPAEEAPPLKFDFVAGFLVAMFNYMGWDNASTIAGEVDRPQRTYPLALGGALLLVVLTYTLPVLAAARTGIAPATWDEGTWVDVGDKVAGPALRAAIAIGGMIAGLGMFNSLVLSYSRVPYALAKDGYLPAVFTRRHPMTGAPWVAILACAVAWALALQLSFRRLVALDVILYGMSLILEFVALVVLRIREPQLARPFRVPGGMIGAVVVGLGPTLLIGAAIFDQSFKWELEGDDPMAPAVALLLGIALAALGPVVYFVSLPWRRKAVPVAMAGSFDSSLRT